MQRTTHTRLKPRFGEYVIGELHGQRIMHCPLLHSHSTIKQKRRDINVNHTHMQLCYRIRNVILIIE